MIARVVSMNGGIGDWYAVCDSICAHAAGVFVYAVRGLGSCCLAEVLPVTNASWPRPDSGASVCVWPPCVTACGVVRRVLADPVLSVACLVQYSDVLSWVFGPALHTTTT